ncbi:hypothetical protein [Leptospira borgpetersenii]|uniref:hypothetical protein n=1 Tax=Leptospira borgpetersenii TaxID=174 RepID=UPI000344E4C8|nr:hypothetical protein [Leptospira borgpetersenii]MBE8400288.1 hypothetical protein [Leptospira borgpetersenii serovar Tarassovi]MBE8403377.1 hypothetical protein [Leptospira borgpetersenii serovar Tarassovi]MBE8406520.1 hypothetical protein [Leptospira borgpetersenii serovar Tarassovi]MBE8412689.1 hypothetical protein [Leptospira borgpetersenii serovar Tarassovi]MBE8415866.1 hypothetical protein [Leptospira borgpetersenii serovar Tarassovi]
MSEKTRINKIIKTEGVKYEIYIPKKDEPDILIYLDEEDFISFVSAVREVLVSEGEEKADV